MSKKKVDHSPYVALGFFLLVLGLYVNFNFGINPTPVQAHSLSENLTVEMTVIPSVAISPTLEIKPTAEPLNIKKVEGHNYVNGYLCSDNISPILCKEMQDKIINKFENNAKSALKIVECESKFDPNSIGDKDLNPMSIGLFQIRHYAPADITHGWFVNRPALNWLLNPDNNIDYAIKMSGNGKDWDSWTCSKIL